MYRSTLSLQGGCIKCVPSLCPDLLLLLLSLLIHLSLLTEEERETVTGRIPSRDRNRSRGLRGAPPMPQIPLVQRHWSSTENSSFSDTTEHCHRVRKRRTISLRMNSLFTITIHLYQAIAAVADPSLSFTVVRRPTASVRADITRSRRPRRRRPY